MKGTVKFFLNQRGWGFITGEDKKDYFVHYSAIQGDSDEIIRTLMDGEKVEFEVIDGRKGKQASNVVITEKYHDPREDIVLKIHNEFDVAIPLLSWIVIDFDCSNLFKSYSIMVSQPKSSFNLLIIKPFAYLKNKS